MCEVDGGSVDHLLIHCSLARELWPGCTDTPFWPKYLILDIHIGPHNFFRNVASSYTIPYPYQCILNNGQWDIVFALFGVQWVMPKRVMDLLACWQCELGRHQNSKIWKVIPHCLIWCLWWSEILEIFRGVTKVSQTLKLQVLKILFDQMLATGLFSFSNLLEFIFSL